MDELLAWVSGQRPGLGTFAAFQERAAQLASKDSDHAAWLQLLSGLANRFVSTYDRMPLGADVASAALAKLVELLERAAASAQGSADEQLRSLNEIARAELG